MLFFSDTAVCTCISRLGGCHSIASIFFCIRAEDVLAYYYSTGSKHGMLANMKVVCCMSMYEEPEESWHTQIMEISSNQKQPRHLSE